MFIGVAEPKLMTSLTISAGSNENRTSGRAAASLSRSVSFIPSVLMPEPSLMATRRMRLFRAAGELVDSVDWKRRRDGADISEREGHILRPDFLLNRCEGLVGQILGAVIVRAVGSSHLQPEFTGIHRRKDLHAEPRPQERAKAIHPSRFRNRVEGQSCSSIFLLTCPLKCVELLGRFPDNLAL
ncbi:hypothetical protein Pan44_10870 [Caulifigura coniformis]|uniref:Uncharacterized protein n=1 Tax=Caulifigura coniformis TaxID=2527983 RepID=A0A517SAD2_9PLAN|nr:hypothetical protein [Caulifigura coniformis]QDT53072.1 hypothetical protein Pan44_10870 [Caulifigura coniformis]